MAKIKGFGFNNDQKKKTKGYMFFCGILRWPKE
jgi:hypothetical protein